MVLSRTLLVFVFAMTAGTALAQSARTSPPDAADRLRKVECRDEKHCFSQLKGDASRSKHTLRLKLADGKFKTFITTQAACDADVYAKCLMYKLIGFYPNLRLYIVDIGFLSHGGVTQLVSARTGNTVQIDAPLQPSPSGKKFVAVSQTETDDGENSIEVWSVTDDLPKSEWRYVVPKDEYALHSFVAWNGDNRIVMKVTTHIKNKLYQDVPVEAVLTEKGWTLMPPKIN